MDAVEVVADGRRYVFPPGSTVVIGRGEQADVRLSEPMVGRAHARLVMEAGHWTLADDSSRNGTWLDGERIARLAVEAPVTVRLGGPAGPPGAAVPPGTAVLQLRPVPVPPEVVTAALQPQPAAPEGGTQGMLVVRIAGRQHLFPAGCEVHVGRDPSLELVSENPLVSRRHGVITSDRHGAYYTDSSTRGTFLGGERVRGRLAITESVVLLLGDPATGEELGITPPIGAAVIAANARRRHRRRRLQRAAAVFAVCALVGAGLAVLATRQGGGRSTTTVPGGSQAILARAESATVRLLMGSPEDFGGWGSGTIITPTGLVLTNGHVAEPQAPGEAVAAGVPQSQLDPDPPYLTVELTKGQSTPAVATYRAKPVAVDGYLDLAVVQIYATTSGTPIDPATLDLPYLPLGNVGALQLDQPVTVIGYPGVSDSDSITVTSGVISTFVPDPLGHVKDPRFELETTARVAHGNSGGAAIDAAGELIGVPSLTLLGEGVDVSWRLRSVTEALPLVEAAKAGKPYTSSWLVQSAAGETVQAVGFSTDQQDACGSSGSVPAGSAVAYVGVRYAGFPEGIDAALEITPDGGSPLTNENGELPQFTLTGGSGCESFQLAAQDIGQQTLEGSFQVQLLAGPELQPVGSPATVSAG
jgi:putative serine protease PepD